MFKKILCAALLLALMDAHAAPQTFLSVNYQPDGPAGASQDYFLTFPANGSHLVLNSGPLLDVSWFVDVSDGPWWSGYFSSGNGAPLSPGDYQSTGQAGQPVLSLQFRDIDLGGAPEGSFHIYESVMKNQLPYSFAATFSLHATDGPATLTGALWRDSSVPFPVPEPATYAMFGLGLGLLELVRRKRATA